MGEIIKIGEGKFEKIWGERCPHKNLIYDIENEEVTCKDCKRIVNPFKALMILISQYRSIEQDLKNRRQELEELEIRKEKHLLKATKAVDQAWRSKSMVPTCPHCHKAIFPGDGFGSSMTNKGMEMETRRFGQSPSKKDQGGRI
jgi:phosphotransacetylase